MAVPEKQPYRLSESFVDLAHDSAYLEFTSIVAMGFEEITREEINSIPDPVKISPKRVLDFKLLVQGFKYDFRNDPNLTARIDKAFSEGLANSRMPLA
jgi:hypothetical protein